MQWNEKDGRRIPLETLVTRHGKVYADFFGIGPEDVSPCERCILNRELKRSVTINQAVDIHHLKFRSLRGGDNIENLGGVCRSCHDVCHADPEENELFGQWCEQLESRTLVIRAFLFREI